MLFHVGAAQVNISIHTPLAGSDHAGTARKGWALYFNPHSPCGERLAFCFNRPHSSIFQSTLPLRGATSRLLRSIRVPKYFNPHSPCGERRHRTRSTTHLLISIHTPLAGSDAMPELFVRDRLRISIHTPLAGSDTGAVESIEIQGISIHTPLAGSDGSTAPCVARRKYFNPHSPCGERLLPCVADGMRTYFNPHSLAGSDFATPQVIAALNVISIHTPLAGSDRQCRVDGETLGISIHTPLAGSDMSPAISGAAFLFQSTLPLWGATSFRRFLIYVITFQSTLPLRGATLQPCGTLIFK